MKIATAFICAALFVAEESTFFTKQEALQEVWGESEIEVEQISDHTFYKSLDGKDNSSASFSTMRVRSKGQTIMLHIADDGTIQKLLVCRFDEPMRYKAPSKFYQQFIGKKLDDDLRLKRGIDGISGATLTSRATVKSVREILTAHAEK
ncbi:MAG: Na+-translocating ferredoxin:NAD+ oxidoreductase RnfG subunit [Myxococcota bacterium]|jgi:Na+-translocating ferredoxin:NAD+ oxidoreductase RnfG subunit